MNAAAAMPVRLAANLSFLYPELPFLDRFEAAARDGFEGVECLFPYEWPAAEIAARLRALGLTQALFNAPPGNWAAGERGLACLPGRDAEFDTSLQQALRYAEVLHCERLHVVAGVLPPGCSAQSQRATYVARLRRAARIAAAEGVRLMIEPINTRDIPGFFLNRQDEAHALLEAIGEPNVQVQFDLYHCQIVEGDVETKIRRYLPGGRVGHFQIAGVPQRHEPDRGELNGPYLIGVIQEVAAHCGWSGWIGCEYRPQRGTTQGLAWRDRLRG